MRYRNGTDDSKRYSRLAKQEKVNVDVKIEIEKQSEQEMTTKTLWGKEEEMMIKGEDRSIRSPAKDPRCRRPER